MKHTKYIITLFVFGAYLTTYGQLETTNCLSIIDTLTGRQIYTFVDNMPAPEKGELILFEELKKLKYPHEYLTMESNMLAAFIVNTDGQLTGKRIINDCSGKYISNQILTLIDNIKWTTGTCNGIPVPVIYLLPVRVCLK